MIEKAKEPLKPYIPNAEPGADDEANKKLSILYNQKYSKGAELMKEILLPGEYATYLITREGEEGEGSMNMYRPPLTFKDYTAYKTSVEEHNARSWSSRRICRKGIPWTRPSSTLLS